MANPFHRLQIWQGQMTLRGRRADFYYDLGMTLDDKIPLFTTLRKYEARARQRKQVTAPLFLHILKRMQSGSLSEALRGVAADTELIMLDAVQASGDAALSSGLKFLSSTVEKIDHLKAVARKAVVYAERHRQHQNRHHTECRIGRNGYAERHRQHHHQG